MPGFRPPTARPLRRPRRRPARARPWSPTPRRSPPGRLPPPPRPRTPHGACSLRFPPRSRRRSKRKRNGRQPGTVAPTAPPETVAEQTGEISFPYAIPDTGLVIQKIAAYDGVFLEDGTDEEITGVAAMVLENTGETAVEYTRFLSTPVARPGALRPPPFRPGRPWWCRRPTGPPIGTPS